MNAYFSALNSRIVDRMAFADDQVHFSNVWGVPTVLFDRVIHRADTAQESSKPFFIW